MKKFYIILLPALLVVCWTGCATLKSGIDGKFDQPGEKNYGADGVSVLFVFSHTHQTKGWDAIPKLDNKWQRIKGFDDFFNDALNEFSNIKSYSTFTEYASDVNEPKRRAQKDSLIKAHDYLIKIKFSREKSFARYFLGSLFSTLSVTLLPVPYTNSLLVEAELYDNDKHLFNNYTRKASLTKWVQTLLLFAYPFHPEQRKKEELYVEFLHDIFRQIETEKRLLPVQTGQ